MLYSFLRVLAYIVLIPAFFIKVIGKENLRSSQYGSIVIANHTSNWDPIILGFVVKHKPVSYMAKEELYRNGIARFFLKRLYTIPVSRGKGDIKAVKTALAALSDGGILGIFPEGTRSKEGVILPFEQGAALLAMRSGVPVIPVYIKGGYRLFRQVKVYVGSSINLKEVAGEKVNSSAIKKATEYLHNAIAGMSKADG